MRRPWSKVQSYTRTLREGGEGDRQTPYVFAFFAGRAKAATDFCGVFGQAAT